MLSHNNLAIIVAAGSRKTQFIVEQALGEPSKRVLVTTYTNENLKQLASRLAHDTGVLPSHVTLAGWFSFLMNECARPYQRAVIGQPNIIRSLNFEDSRNLFTPRSQAQRFFLDSNHDMYRDGVSHFACEAERATGGLVTKRLSGMFDHVYIDEIQDLVGYDLDFLDCLMNSSLALTVVGDPRQHTYSTNTSGRNKKYQGAGLFDWLTERKAKCIVEHRCESFRCNQAICDFADALYPELPATTSRNTDSTGHDGVFTVPRSQVLAYVHEYNPMVLRHNKNSDTLGLSAMNYGQSKGGTYDRVLIFPTAPMRKYLASKDLLTVGSKDRLYVAVTRARHSVAFVVPG
jgi:hypothetical protein